MEVDPIRPSATSWIRRSLDVVPRPLPLGKQVLGNSPPERDSRSHPPIRQVGAVHVLLWGTVSRSPATDVAHAEGAGRIVLVVVLSLTKECVMYLPLLKILDLQYRVCAGHPQRRRLHALVVIVADVSGGPVASPSAGRAVVELIRPDVGIHCPAVLHHFYFYSII